MNSIIVLLIVLLIAFSREIQEKNIEYHESRTFSSFICNEKSFFLRISFVLIQELNRFECNVVYSGQNNITALALINNEKEIVLNLFHSNFVLRDLNGTEIYSSLGVVRDGQCLGAVVYIYGENHVIGGSCDSEFGVKAVESSRDNSLFAMRGVCDCTCWGTMTTLYSPGKFNSYKNN